MYKYIIKLQLAVIKKILQKDVDIIKKNLDKLRIEKLIDRKEKQ